MRRIAFALTISLLLPVAAKADTFAFSINGGSGSYTGTGTLTATNNNNGSYTVTGIAGTGITGLITAFDPNYGYGNDNLLYSNPAGRFDNDGIAFYGSFGSANLYLASLAAGYEVQGYTASGTYFDTPATLQLTAATIATPEPSSFLLALTGLAGGLTASLRKRLARVS